MKKLKKIISCLLGFTFLIGATFSVVGCKDKEEGQKETTYISDMDQGINREKSIGYLVENGISDYQILIPSTADECIRYAASEMQKYINQTSGVRLPIVEDSAAQIFLSGKFISLGETSLRELAGFKVDYDSLNDDGFLMKTKNNALYIVGERNSGVLYGVYDFCERILGTRFLTNDYTYIEERDKIVLYEMDRIEIPAFSVRWYYAQQTMKQLEFVTRQRQTPIYNNGRPALYGDGGYNTYYKGVVGHTVVTELLPTKVYLADHEDWYATNTEVASQNDLCYTNGITEDGELDKNDNDSMAMEMLRVCKDIILQNDTNADTIFIGQEDNQIWCQCDDCVKSGEKYGGRSGTLLTFINAIAKELEEWNESEKLGKKITVETFAYLKTIDPPGEIDKDGEWKPKVKARANVAVQYAWMGCNLHSITEACTINRTHAERFKHWEECAENITIWDYATNFSHNFFWFENFDSLVKNYKYYLDIGVTRVMTQGAPHVSNYYQGHLENYVVAKLLWNPWYDVNELINEFNYYYYGDSYQTMNDFVSYMRAYYKTLDLNTLNGFHTALYTDGYFLMADNYSLSFLTGAINMLQKEIDRVNADETLVKGEKNELVKRLWQAQIQPEYMVLHNYDSYYDPSGKKDFAKQWFAKVDALGIQYYSEGGSVNSLKTALGVS